MSLEQDIKQKEFRNEYHKALLNILYTENYLVSKMNDGFKKFDLTRQQYNVLRILRGKYPEPATINIIKDRMLEKMSDSSRIVERLRLKGLIQREDGRNDKRSVEITITQEGLDLLSTMKEEVEEMETFLDNLTEEEVQLLNMLLDKIRKNDLPELEKHIQVMDLINQPEKI